MNSKISSLLISLTVPPLLTSLSCAQKTDHVVNIHTKYGDMVVILYDETPKHKENFIRLVNEKYYDSLLFHRVIPGFMIQGGDPASKNAEPNTPLGSGGPDYTIEAEIRDHLFHMKGSLSAARLGDAQNPTKASSGSQFYIVQGTVLTPESLAQSNIDQNKLNTALREYLSKDVHLSFRDSLNTLYLSGDMDAYQRAIYEAIPEVEKETGIRITKPALSSERTEAYSTVGGSPHLDGEYTVFGRVIKGLEVIDSIANVERNPSDRPLDDIRMTVSIQTMSRKKISKKYGYVYPSKSDQ